MQNTTTPLSPEQQSWLEQTFSRNRDLFGGYVMEEGAGEQTGSEEESEEAPEETPENAPEGTEEAPESEEESEEEESSTLSHQDALEALSKTRKSEARYRTRLRDLEKQLESAVTQEQVEEIRNSLRSENHELLVENVARKHGLPDDLASALKGDTRDELEAHAKVLAKYAAPANNDDPELEGGLDPKELGGTGKSAADLSREARRRRR